MQPVEVSRHHLAVELVGFGAIAKCTGHRAKWCVYIQAELFRCCTILNSADSVSPSIEDFLLAQDFSQGTNVRVEIFGDEGFVADEGRPMDLILKRPRAACTAMGSS